MSDYERMDINELTRVLLAAEHRPDVQRAALSALSRREPLQRNSRLVLVMEHVVRFPDRYDQDLMTMVIDLLATDPTPYATSAMLDLLPGIVAPLLEGGTALKPAFREYFYQALNTRRRKEDLAVWGEVLPRLDIKTLVGVLADPASRSLELLQPLKLLDQLSEPLRTRGLMYAISAASRAGAPLERITAAARRLRAAHYRAEFEKGLAQLEAQWEEAARAKDKEQKRALEAALHIVDTRRRSLGEVLRGRRPWMSRVD